MKKDYKTFSGYSYVALAIIATIINISIAGAQQNISGNNTTPEGTSKIWGYVNNTAIIGLVEGPATAKTTLQIACVFEYTEGDIFNSPPALPPAQNGMVHLDEALNGKITEIRKTGKFEGQALTTFLITPPKGSIKAKKLLLIGLGDRNDFTPELMTLVGEVATREAIKLGMRDVAISSDLKDAGIDSPTALVAGNIAKGIMKAVNTEKYLKANNLSNNKLPDRIYLLAGGSFFTIAGEGIQEAINGVTKSGMSN